MTVFDPYAVLAVAPGASDAAIKSAYRSRVQVAHPDRGGDPDAFILVVKAFGLLSDPAARRLYDEAGIIDEEGVTNYRRDVAIILADMFDAAVESAMGSGLRLQSVDFIAQMTAAVKRGLAEARVGLARLRSEMQSLEALSKRIRRNGGGENLFSSRLAQQFAGKLEAETAMRRRVALYETAIVELGNYENEVELIAALEASA